jgi:hypothetical protein
MYLKLRKAAADLAADAVIDDRSVADICGVYSQLFDCARHLSDDRKHSRNAYDGALILRTKASPLNICEALWVGASENAEQVRGLGIDRRLWRDDQSELPRPDEHCQCQGSGLSYRTRRLRYPTRSQRGKRVPGPLWRFLFG